MPSSEVGTEGPDLLFYHCFFPRTNACSSQMFQMIKSHLLQYSCSASSNIGRCRVPFGHTRAFGHTMKYNVLLGDCRGWFVGWSSCLREKISKPHHNYLVLGECRVVGNCQAGMTALSSPSISEANVLVIGRVGSGLVALRKVRGSPKQQRRMYVRPRQIAT